MTNQERRELLNRFRTSGMEGSILDVYAAAKEGRDIISEHQAMQESQNPIQAITPEQQREGLRPYHAAGDTDRSMVFKDVPPNTPFNTMGMKRPINIEKVDKQGHLIESHKSVPPGLKHIPTGPYEGDVIETPADGYRDGGFLQNGGSVESADIDNTLDAVTLEHYLSDTRGRQPDFWRATVDTLAFHESGPHQRMSPTAIQDDGGPGRGMLQFEPDALETAKNRYQQICDKLGFDSDPEIMSAESADQLSKDQQYVLFYSDVIKNTNVKLQDYADGKMSIEELWMKGHKKKEAPGDRASFQESREAAKTGLKDFGLKMGGARRKWSKKRNGGPKGDDPNEAAIKNLMRLQQAYLDALAASGTPPYMNEGTDNRQYAIEWADFHSSIRSDDVDPLPIDAKLDNLDDLEAAFRKEAKRLKELGLITDIREIGYYSHPSYGPYNFGRDDDDEYRRNRRAHGTRHRIYDIVLPPKRKPPPPAPEKIEKKKVEPLDNGIDPQIIIKPPVPTIEPIEEEELVEEEKRRQQLIGRDSMYRRKLFGPNRGQLVAKKRKFRRRNK